MILGMCGLIVTWGCRNRPDRTQHRPEPAHGIAESADPTSDRGAGQQTTAVPEETQRITEQPSGGPAGTGAPTRGPGDQPAEDRQGANAPGASASELPSEADIQACMKQVRRFSPDPDLVKQLRFGSMVDWSHKPLMQIHGPGATFTCGVKDHRVYHFHPYHAGKLPALARPLSVNEATAKARTFLQERGLAITPEMRLTRQEMSTAGNSAGHVTLEWRAYRKEVELPRSFEVEVDTASGYVLSFSMRDEEVSADLTERLTPEEVHRIAVQHAKWFREEPVIVDKGLIVWLDRDGTQRLCRVVDLTRRGNPEGITRTIVDANTGEIVMSACSGGSG